VATPSGNGSHARALGQFYWVDRPSSTAEARLPPVRVDMPPGTGLGIVGKGGTHGLPPPLLVTACLGSGTVGKEAGLVVVIWGNLPRRDNPQLAKAFPCSTPQHLPPSCFLHILF
jgi:hypothetical protein